MNRVEAGGPHPDPGLLAALGEQSLGARDRSDLLGHLSACGECRELLYLAQPDLANDPQVVLFPRKSRPLATGWATLAASVIIAAGVLVSNRSIFTQHRREARPAGYSANQETAQSAVNAGPVSPAGNAETDARVRPPEKHMTARPRANMQFDESGEVHIARPTARGEAGRPGASRTQSMAGPGKIKPAVWRLSPGGKVEDSLDSGSHWQVVPVANGTRFRAINSVGDEVWIGGDGGALYHSGNSGRSWARVTPAASGKTLASEITGIQFSDLENGTVTTADGQVWRTSDCGKNWQLK